MKPEDRVLADITQQVRVRVRTFLRVSGKSNRWLARRFGVTDSRMSQLLVGRYQKQWTLRTIVRLTRAVGMRVRFTVLP